VFRILVPIIFLLQGIPVQQGGKVTGVLRDNTGAPLEGVRIAAVARGGTIEDAASGAAMAGLAQTDEQGRFTLEDVPPGRYSIAAGRLDLQTYYPGTQSLADATILTVTAGETVSGINFVLNNTSFGRSAGSGTPRITASIPVRVTMENGGKLPISADGKLIYLRLESTSGVVAIPIDGVSFLVPGPVATDFRVSVEDLPDIYEVKSIAYGSTAVPQGIFRLTAANFPTLAAGLTTFVMPSPLPSTEAELRTLLDSIVRLGQTVPSQPPAQASPNSPSLAASLLTSPGFLAGYIQGLTSGGSLKPAATPPSTLTITLGEVTNQLTGGVRVSGKTGNRDKRRAYISGKPGVVFADGSFEFRTVPPGRHLIAATGNGRAFAAVIVVGDKNVDGIELTETPLLPDDARVPKDPMPAGDLAPGTVVPLARITGVVIEETSKMPLTEGEVQIRSGDSFRMVNIDSTGRFEFTSLLPGTYELRMQIFGHTSVGPTIVVEDKNVDLEVTSRRLY
jgi:hypothetical protein